MRVHQPGQDAGSGSARMRRREGGTSRPLLTRVGAVAATAALGVVGWALPAQAATPTAASRAAASASGAARAAFAAATKYDPAGDGYSLYNDEKLMQVRDVWAMGFTGKGVDVALIDSGVAPVAGLSDAGKVLNGPDLTPESQNPATRYLDTYGHGTHMAGIIAGHDTAAGTTSSTYATDTTHFLGVAPDARIVSVKAGDAHGNTDVSQVIAGIDWVVQHAHDPGMNIRVLNLSFGTDSTQSWTVDPLAYAVEAAWKAGIVVVTSAGNTGSGGVTNPATNPHVVAVGAVDTHGTAALTDDTVPDFSSVGKASLRSPDLIAPGTHVQSLRVPGSYIDNTYGSTGRINGRFFRGSGTSQAAAFASGAAALFLQYDPTATPDEVKVALTGGYFNNAIPGTSDYAQGDGILSIHQAIVDSWSTSRVMCPGPNGIWVPGIGRDCTFATGTGSLGASRGDSSLVLNGVTLAGERDIMGQPFDAAAMAGLEAVGKSWADGTWNGKSWAGSTWSGKSWATGNWDGKSWAGSTWSGKSWAGSSWAGSRWSGKSWADDSWS